MISVENLLSENFPRLLSQRPSIRRPMLAFLRYLFHESEFKRFEDQFPHLKGFDFVEQVLDYFDFSYHLNDREKERIPATGRVVIIANHPIGSLDGLSLLKLIGDVRRDVKVVANDMLLAIKPLNKLLLPVDNMDGRTVRKNIKNIENHLNNEGAVIIFPAGEVSRMSPQGVRDGKWNKGFLRFAEKTRSPLLPVFIDARNSAFFYSLSMLARPISTLWLVREMFKHAKRDIRMRIGHTVAYDLYHPLPFSRDVKAKLLKKDLYKLSRKRSKRLFIDNMPGIAHPENRRELRDEIRQAELIGSTSDGKQIFLYRYSGDSAVMREVSRLRELSFRAVGEGSGKRRDMDHYDSYYDHILLWDDDDLEIVGAYRMVKTASVIDAHGVESLYTSTLFDYKKGSEGYLNCGLELGRSFVQPQYQGKRSLDYLWFGIGAYLKRFPEVRYLLGPVSLSNAYPEQAKDMLVAFYQYHFPASSLWAEARVPYQASTSANHFDDEASTYQTAFTQLKKQFTEMGLSVPVLYKQYSEVCERGGVQFVDFNVDENFADCVDGLVVVDMDMLKATKRKRYLGE